MALAAGTRLGPYEIVEPLGAGGMGEVYRAHDSRLGRDVAVKVLPESVSSDAERLARFITWRPWPATKSVHTSRLAWNCIEGSFRRGRRICRRNFSLSLRRALPAAFIPSLDETSDVTTVRDDDHKLGPLWRDRVSV